MNRNYGILIGVAVVVVVVGIMYAMYSNPSQPAATAAPTSTYMGGNQGGGQAGSTIVPGASGSPAATSIGGPGASASPRTTPSATPGTQGTPAGSVRKISVDGNEFVFLPSEIRVKAGERAQITFTNKGSRPHDMQILNLNAGTGQLPLSPGQSKTFELTAPAQKNAAGYQFICSLPGHAERGMVGRLIVE